MFRSRFPVLIVMSALASASCGPTPTPTPPGPSQVTINSPQEGAVYQWGSMIPASVQAASFTDVTGFEVTRCNSDEIQAGSAPNHVGEGGPYGSMYYYEGVLNATELGECTRKVRARYAGDLYTPWVAVTYTVEDLYQTTNTIDVSILAPTQGDVIPPNAGFTISFQADSPGAIERFEFEICYPEGQLIDYPPEATHPGGSQGFITLADFAYSFPDGVTGPCTLRMRAVSEQTPAQVSDWDIVHFTIAQNVAKPTPTIVIIPFIPEAADTPGGSFQAAILKNANCRAGPGTAYNEWDYALKGEMVEVVGRNEDGSWVNVINPHAAGKCWLSIVAFDAAFDVNGLPAVSYPTPPPSAGGDDGETAQGCWVRSAAGGDTVCMAPCPPDASPGTACTP